STTPHTYISVEHSLYPRRLELDASVGWELREVNYDRKIALSVPSRHVNEIDFCLGSCVTSNAGSKRRHATVLELEEGPSGSAIRSPIPSHHKLLRSKAVVVSVVEKSGL